MATERVGRAVLEFSTDSAQFNRDVDQAGKKIDELKTKASGFSTAFKDAGTAFTGFGESAIKLGTSLSMLLTGPIAAAIAGVGALGLAVMQTGEDIAKGAREAGLSAQGFQELTFAVGQVSRLGADEATKGFQKLTVAIGEAANGSKPAQTAFERLGFTQAEIASGTIDTEDAFNRMNTAIQASKSPAEAAALAGDLMGNKLGPRLAGALRESGDEVDALRDQFRELGLGMSDEALAASEKLNDQIDVVTRQFGALGRTIGAEVLPIISDQLIPFLQGSVVPVLRDVAKGIGDLIKGFGELSPGMKAVILVGVGIAAALGPVLLIVGQLATSIGAILALIGRWTAASTVNAAAQATQTTATVAQTVAVDAQAVAYKALETRVRGTANASGGLVSVIGVGGVVTAVLAATAAAWKLEAATAAAADRMRDGTATLSDIPAVAANSVARGLNPIRAAWEDISKAIKDTSTAWDHFRGKPLTMPDLPDVADRPTGVLFDASAPGLPKGAELKAINDALIAGLKASQQATKDFRAELAAARAEIGALSKNDLADLTAAVQSNAFSTEDLQKKYHLSDVALKLFTESVKGSAKEHRAAETAVSRHRAELEKLEDWLASKGVLTTTGYSDALGDLVEKLNLAAREGTPVLRAALAALGPDFDKLRTAARASGQDVSALDSTLRQFLGLAGLEQLAADTIAWDAANVLTAGSLNDILTTLPTVSVDAEAAALSAQMLTDSYHEFGLKTPAELQKAADAARFAYQQIVATVGKNAPAAIEAHKKMVEAINAQTGRIPSFWETNIFPRVSEVVKQLQTAISGSFAQMLLGAKSFKDGFVDIWKSIKAGVLNILAQIADSFINSFLKGILGALTGQRGAFSQAFSGLFGGAGNGLLGSLFGAGGAAASGGVAVGGSTGGLLGAGGASTTGGLLGAGTAGGTAAGTGAAAGGGTAAGGAGGAAGGGLAAGLAGGAAAAGGGVLLGMLGKQIFGGAGWKAGGFGAASGAATGALIGSVVPVLGTAIGALVGGLAGLFSGWIGKTQAMKVNDARDQVIGQFGPSGTGAGSGFAVLAGELAKITGGGDIFHALIKASNFKDFEAAVKRVQAALESTEYATVKVREATEQLTAERDKLTASGESEDAVLRQQAASYSTLFQTIQATGATAPASLQPILEKLVEMGLLVDATGQKVTDLSKTFPTVGEAAAKQGAAIEVAMVRSQAAIDQINTDNPQAAVNAVRSALEALGTETAPAATVALQTALDQLNTGDPQEAVLALRKALEALSAQHAESEFTTLGKVAEDQAARAAAALAGIGRNIPPISLRYRYSQDGPGLPDGADVRALAGGGVVRPLYAATGTFVPRGTDTVPAMLTPGEYVIPKMTVDRLGLGFLQGLSRAPMPSMDASRPGRAADAGDGHVGDTTFQFGDVHIAVPPGTARPEVFGAQVADAFFGRLKRGGEHLDLMRHFVQKVQT